MPRSTVRPFEGDFNSTAFHARDVAAINSDPRVIAFQRFASVLEGQMSDDPAPCFAIAKGVDPRAPLFVMRQPTEVVIGEWREDDPEVDDSNGWITMLQGHIEPDEGLIVTEWNNPAAPDRQLTWAITVDAVRCFADR